MPHPVPYSDSACLRARTEAQGPAETTWADLWTLAWPLVLSMLLQFSVGLADVYVAGRFRPEVQGAIGFAGQLLFFFNVIANGLGVGLVAVASRRHGACEIEAMWQAVRQGLLLTIAFTAPLAVLGILWVPAPLLGFFLPPPVLEAVKGLLPFYAASLLPQGLLVMAAAVFRARSQMLPVLLCTALTSLLNLGGDFVLAFGLWSFPALGPRGIALATAASTAAGAGLVVALLFRQGLGRGSWHSEPPLAKRLLQLGWPVGLLQLGWQLGSLFLYGILGQLPRQAVAATAAFTNGLRIEAILYLPAFALNMVTAVLVGQALGMHNARQAERAGWRVAGAAAAVLTLLALPVFLYSWEIAGLITPDREVQQLTHLYLRFNMLSQPFMALGVCLGGALEGAGDTMGTMKVVLAALWGVRLPLAAGLALATPLGANGVWLAMVFSMVLQGILLVHRFRRGRWKEIRIFMGTEGEYPWRSEETR